MTFRNRLPPAGILLIAIVMLAVPLASADHIQGSPTEELLPPCGTLEGTVTDTDEGDSKGLEGITIIATAAGANSGIQGYSETQTGSQGEYSLQLRAGQWQVTALDETGAHLPDTATKFVTCDQTTTHDFSLRSSDAGVDPQAGSITVALNETVNTTVDPDETEPLVRETISLSLAEGDCEVSLEEKQTDENGEATFEDLLVGVEYCVTFGAESYENASATTKPEEGDSEKQVELRTNRILQTLSVQAMDNVAADTVENVWVNVTHPTYCPSGNPSIPSIDCQNQDLTVNDESGVELELPWSDETYQITVADEDPRYETETRQTNLTKGGGGSSLQLNLAHTMGHLQGTVTDTDGNSVSSADVCLNLPVPVCAVTDSTGFYEMKIAWGIYDIHVEKDGFLDRDTTADVEPGVTTTKDLTLSAGGTGTIKGKVCDEDLSTSPCNSWSTNATVEAVKSGNVKASTSTNADGKFTLEVPAPDTYDIQVTAPHHQPATQTDVHVPEAQSTDVGQFDLPRNTYTLSVTVENSTGSTQLDQADVEADATTSGLDESASCQTDASGKCDLQLLWGDYDVTAERTTEVLYDAQTHSVTVDGSSSQTFQLSKTSTRTISGTVTDADYDGALTLDGASVGVTDHDADSSGIQTGLSSSEYTLTATTGSSGSSGDYALVVPETRSVVVTVTLQDYQDQDVTVGETATTKDISLSRVEYLLSGTVTDADDEANREAGGLDVQVDGANTVFQSTVTTDDNGYYEKQVPWDAYDLTVTDSDSEYQDRTIQNVGVSQDTVRDTDVNRVRGTVEGTIQESLGPAGPDGRDLADDDRTISESRSFDLTCTGGQTGEQKATVSGSYSIDLPWDREGYQCEILDDSANPEYHGATDTYGSADDVQEESEPNPDDPGSGLNTDGRFVLSPEGTRSGIDIPLERKAWTVQGEVSAPLDESAGSNARVCATQVADGEVQTTTCTDTDDGTYAIDLTYLQDSPRWNTVTLVANTANGAYIGSNVTLIGPDAGALNPHPVTADISLVPSQATLPSAPSMTEAITGTVTDADARNQGAGTGIAGVVVTATKQQGDCEENDDGSEQVQTVTQPTGEYVLAVPCEGTYEVVVEDHPLYQPPSAKEATVSPTENLLAALGQGGATEDFELDREIGGGVVSVLDEGGGSVDGASVSVDGVDVSTSSTASTNQGSTPSLDLPWGIYELTVTGPTDEDWLVGSDDQPFRGGLLMLPSFEVDGPERTYPAVLVHEPSP